MRTITICLSVFFLFSGSSFGTTINSAAGDPASSVPGLDNLASAFLEVFSSGNTDALDDYMINADIARQLSPDRTKGMSDSQIEEQMIDPLKKRFAENLDAIWKQVDAEELAGAEFQIISLSEDESNDSPMVPRAVTLSFAADGKNARVPFTYVSVGDNLYVLEILFSTEIFKKQ